MTIDSHAHIFPYFGGPAGYGNRQERLTYLQRASATGIGSNIRRRADHRQAQMPPGALWDPADSSPSGLRDVAFRVGRHGQIEWTLDGEDYYVQTFPPLMEDMTATPETIVAMMDWAGVDKAVLQNDHIYGNLNHYFSMAVNRYPNRFIGLIQVDEANLDSPSQLALLTSSTKELGLRGLYYKSLGLFRNGNASAIDDPRFDPFWEQVARQLLPVFWDVSPPQATPDASFRELRQILNVIERHPDIGGIVQGGVLRLFGPLAFDDAMNIPQELLDLVRESATLLEVLLPIFCGGRFEYPYTELHELLALLYDTFGPSKLVWGSDVPNVERYCTYRQSLQYLTRHCDFLTSDDLQLIVGENIEKLFAEH